MVAVGRLYWKSARAAMHASRALDVVGLPRGPPMFKLANQARVSAAWRAQARRRLRLQPRRRRDAVPPRAPTAFKDHCEAQGLAGVTFHAVRHTHITTLLQRVGKAGAKAVSQRAGHANLSTTLEVYQTVFEEDDRALADLSAPLFNRK